MENEVFYNLRIVTKERGMGQEIGSSFMEDKRTKQKHLFDVSICTAAEVQTFNLLVLKLQGWADLKTTLLL